MAGSVECSVGGICEHANYMGTHQGLQMLFTTSFMDRVFRSAPFLSGTRVSLLNKTLLLRRLIQEYGFVPFFAMNLP
ncbi:hypothetical protein CEXT_783921 [Caerostris extrusa]|uniref:Uncharacterized protein n=1 Tax=Caerostris extrusa TaxID=172846 RepID=A0AAV4W495_CAEEX|nr:hypothetical protein CEXT_783921 [Caerostris extrusa]